MLTDLEKTKNKTISISDFDKNFVLYHKTRLETVFSKFMTLVHENAIWQCTARRRVTVKIQYVTYRVV